MRTVLETRQRICAVLVATTATLASAIAHADDAPSAAPAAAAEPSPQEQEARTRVQRGLALFDEGEYRVALVELERAYEILPSYKILYNIGQIHVQLGEYARALTTLRRYLDEGGTEIAKERRDEVEKDIAGLWTRVAKLSITINVWPASTRSPVFTWTATTVPGIGAKAASFAALPLALASRLTGSAYTTSWVSPDA